MQIKKALYASLAITLAAIFLVAANTTNAQQPGIFPYWNTYQNATSTAAGGIQAARFCITGGGCLTNAGGTVTSIGLAVPVGFTVANSPITTSGTLGVSYDTGYGPVLTASTTEWAQAYASTTALSNGYIRNLFSATAPITYDSAAGQFGFTNPGYISDITGLITQGSNITITGSGTSGDPYEIAATGGTSLTGSTGQIAYFSGTDTAVGTSSIVIASSGQVGIGTTTPSAALSVTNSTAAPSFIVEDSTSPDTTPFVVDAAGMVGVGTSSPTQDLDVSKNVSGDAVARVKNVSTGATARALLSVTNTESLADGASLFTTGTNYTATGMFSQDSAVLVSSSGLSGGLAIGTAANSALRFFTAGTATTDERMRITAAGLVGIVGSSRVDLQACKLEYSIVSPK